MLKIKYIALIFVLGFMLFTLFAVIPTYGQSEKVWEKIQENFQPVEQTYGGLPVDPRAIVGLIIKIVLMVLGMVYTALVVYGGILWMMAQGNSEQISKAKSTIIHGAVGVGIIITAFSLARLAVIGLGCAVQWAAELCLFMNYLSF